MKKNKGLFTSKTGTIAGLKGGKARFLSIGVNGMKKLSRKAQRARKKLSTGVVDTVSDGVTIKE